MFASRNQKTVVNIEDIENWTLPDIIAYGRESERGKKKKIC